MSTKYRSKLIEQSKVVVAEALVESDELSQDEVRQKTRELMEQTMMDAQELSMKYKR